MGEKNPGEALEREGTSLSKEIEQLADRSYGVKFWGGEKYQKLIEEKKAIIQKVIEAKDEEAIKKIEDYGGFFPNELLRDMGIEFNCLGHDMGTGETFHVSDDWEPRHQDLGSAGRKIILPEK